jgi:hypothetical protein
VFPVRYAYKKVKQPLYQAVQAVRHRGSHIVWTIDSYIRFEIFTAVTMKNIVFWDITPCGSCTYLRFRGTYRLHSRADKNPRARNNICSN